MTAFDVSMNACIEQLEKIRLDDPLGPIKKLSDEQAAVLPTPSCEAPKLETAQR